MALLAQRRDSAVAQALQARARQLDRFADRIGQAWHRQQTAAQQRLALLGQRLQALDPAGVLARGYAWVADEAGVPLLSVTQVHTGQALVTHLGDGRVESVVSAVRAGTVEGAGEVTRLVRRRRTAKALAAPVPPMSAMPD